MSQELKDRALALTPEERALLVGALEAGKGFTGALRGLSPLKNLPAEELAELKEALVAPVVEEAETPIPEPAEEPVKDEESDEFKEALTDVKKSAREIVSALARLGRSASAKTSNQINLPEGIEKIKSKAEELEASEKLNSLKEKSVDSWEKFLDFSEKKLAELEKKYDNDSCKCKEEWQCKKNGSWCAGGCRCKKNESKAS